MHYLWLLVEKFVTAKVLNWHF